MSNFALETVLQRLKQVAESFCKHEGPLTKIINACNRFISLKELARLDRMKKELNDALYELNEYTEALKRLIADARKYFD